MANYMENNKLLDLTDPYDDMEFILDKSEKEVDQLLVNLDTLNDIKVCLGPLDFVEDIDLAADESEYADFFEDEKINLN